MFENQLHPIMLATQDRTLIGVMVKHHGHKYYNKRFDSKLTRKML